MLNNVHKRVKKKGSRMGAQLFSRLDQLLIVYLLGVNAHKVVGIKKDVA